MKLILTSLLILLIFILPVALPEDKGDKIRSEIKVKLEKVNKLNSKLNYQVITSNQREEMGYVIQTGTYRDVNGGVGRITSVASPDGKVSTLYDMPLKCGLQVPESDKTFFLFDKLKYFIKKIKLINRRSQ